MKLSNILLSSALVALSPLAAAAQTSPAPAQAETVQATGEQVTAKVNGLVCDFCAVALIKTFGREDAVHHVDVDLDASEVRIAMKPGQTLDDARIRDLIRRSGYALVGIERRAS
jgi:copper chaperone CopZ